MVQKSGKWIVGCILHKGCICSPQVQLVILENQRCSIALSQVKNSECPVILDQSKDFFSDMKKNLWLASGSCLQESLYFSCCAFPFTVWNGSAKEHKHSHLTFFLCVLILISLNSDFLIIFVQTQCWLFVVTLALESVQLKQNCKRRSCMDKDIFMLGMLEVTYSVSLYIFRYGIWRYIYFLYL